MLDANQHKTRHDSKTLWGSPTTNTMVRRVQTQARDGSTPTKVATFNKKDPPNAISQASPDKAGSTAPKVLRVHKNEPVYEVDDARASRVAAEADGHALYAKRLAEDLSPAQQRCVATPPSPQRRSERPATWSAPATWRSTASHAAVFGSASTMDQFCSTLKQPTTSRQCPPQTRRHGGASPKGQDLSR